MTEQETKKQHDAAAAPDGAAAGGTGEAKAPAPDKKEKAAKQAKKPKTDAAALAALEEKLAGAEKREAELKDGLLRTAAEYDNYRRRSQVEKDASFSNGVAHAAGEMLPVLDVLYAAAEAETADAGYKKGVLLTLDKCKEVFAKLGITEIEAQNEPFDPELHNACMQEACEGVESGRVSRVVQRGYVLNGRVIRHAMVAVAI